MVNALLTVFVLTAARAPNTRRCDRAKAARTKFRQIARPYWLRLHGGLNHFEAIFASGTPPAHKETRHEEGSDCSGSGCERGCCHHRLAETCGCALLWLRRRRGPAGWLCCRRNSRQRIGKAISISLLRACSGLLLWAGSVSWLLAMAPRVPLSGVLSRDGTESSRAAWKFPSGGSKPLQLVMRKETQSQAVAIPINTITANAIETPAQA